MGFFLCGCVLGVGSKTLSGRSCLGSSPGSLLLPRVAVTLTGAVRPAVSPTRGSWGVRLCRETWERRAADALVRGGSFCPLDLAVRGLGQVQGRPQMRKSPADWAGQGLAHTGAPARSPRL